MWGHGELERTALLEEGHTAGPPASGSPLHKIVADWKSRQRSCIRVFFAEKCEPRTRSDFLTPTRLVNAAIHKCRCHRPQTVPHIEPNDGPLPLGIEQFVVGRLY